MAHISRFNVWSDSSLRKFKVIFNWKQFSPDFCSTYNCGIPFVQQNIYLFAIHMKE